MQRGSEDADYYEVLAAKSIKLQNRVADIVKELDFQGDETGALLDAMQGSVANFEGWRREPRWTRD
jgi:hypothetical protein